VIIVRARPEIITSAKQSGFSLVEISLIIVIIAFILGAITFTVQARRDMTNIYTTKERMQSVIDAIDRYVENYGHLPCPANPTIADTNPNFGWGTGSNSSTANCPQAVTLVNDGDDDLDLMIGMIPFKSLIPPLPHQVAVDGYNNRFSYIVVQGYTNVDNYTNSSTDLGDNFIICNHLSCSGAGTNIAASGDIAYILISHGEHDHNAYADKIPGSGTNKVSLSSPRTDDAENGDADRTFVFTMPSKDFDDIIIVKNRWQLPNYLNE
jgi:type II secretory pathway pseudopilin PulG